VCLLQLPAGSASVEGKVEPHERKPHADRLCRRTGVLSGISVDGLLMKEVPARSFRVVSRQVRGDRRDRAGGQGTSGGSFWAQAGFIALYAVALGLAAGFGALLLRNWRWATATTATVAVFMVVTFPYVDFLNECNVGQPLISWSTQRC